MSETIAKPKNVVFRNVAAVIMGWFLGSCVNMGLVYASPHVVPPPDGVNPADMDSLRENIHKFEPKHCVMPFLAHALGTLVGAFAAAKIAASRHFTFAMSIGVLFLLGGIAIAAMLPAPVWFEAADIVLAYLPMGWLGWKLSGRPM